MPKVLSLRELSFNVSDIFGANWDKYWNVKRTVGQVIWYAPWKLGYRPSTQQDQPNGFERKKKHLFHTQKTK